MGFLTRNLRQDVVYWGTPTPDGMGGNTFDTYVQIVGRWEDTNRKFINANGEEVISKAVVYLEQDVDMGGWLFLGTTSDVGSANQDNPERVVGAHEIRGINKTPDIKGTDFEREVFL